MLFERDYPARFQYLTKTPFPEGGDVFFLVPGELKCHPMADSIGMASFDDLASIVIPYVEENP